MKFCDLIKTTPTKKVYQAVVDKYYLDSKSTLEEFVEYHMLAYFQLIDMKPVKTNMILDVQWFDADEIDIKIYGDTAQEECAGYGVSGYNPDDSFNDGSDWGEPQEGWKESYAIEFTPWNEWLDMELSLTTMMIPYPMVIAECLWEMTFLGGNPGVVEERGKYLLDRCKECMDAVNSGECETHPIDNLT